MVETKELLPTGSCLNLQVVVSPTVGCCSIHYIVVNKHSLKFTINVSLCYPFMYLLGGLPQLSGTGYLELLLGSLSCCRERTESVPFEVSDTQRGIALHSEYKVGCWAEDWYTNIYFIIIGWSTYNHVAAKTRVYIIICIYIYIKHQLNHSGI